MMLFTNSVIEKIIAAHQNRYSNFVLKVFIWLVLMIFLVD